MNLTQGEAEIETLKEAFYRKWLGGYGLGVKIVYGEITPKTDPLGPWNIIGLTTGILTGTPVPFSGSFTAVGKSPITGTWGDSRGGGFFGSELKLAGFDAVFFYGKSEKPVYLWVNDGKARVMDASGIWGRTVNETEDMLKEEHDDKKVQVASIGPSGEKLSLSAAIITDKGRAAGRSGLAAVMGAKKLKAVAVRGTGKIPVADDEKLLELRKKALEAMNKNPMVSSFRKYGMSGGTARSIFSGDCPVKNWAGVGEIDFPTAEKISGDNVIKYDVGAYACFNCPVGCGGLQKVERGPYAVEGQAGV